MGTDFSRTNMGHKFYESDVPRIANALEKLAKALEKHNELIENGGEALSPTSLGELANSFKSDATAARERAMTSHELKAKLLQVHESSNPGKVEDGTRVHIQYKSFGKPTEKAKQEASPATDLGLANDRYTGRVSRIWRTASGDICLNLFVELERDHRYRTLNLDKGEVFTFYILGD